MKALIAITTPYFWPGEAEAIARRLDADGFERVHLRKPEATEQQLRALIEAIPARLRERLSLHDCFGLAVEYGLGGVHLNSRNPMPPPSWGGLVSCSLHSVDELRRLPAEIDYAFISPIFPSISKRGYRGEFGEELREVLSPRIYALGGVTPERLPQLSRMGFSAAAMLGAAWRRPINMSAFSLQFITHPVEGIPLPAQARLTTAGGCRWVQLRHKGASRSELLRQGGEIAEICRRAGATFIIDDHVELVTELDADGVHLGKNDMPVAEARALLGPDRIIGATANSFDDIEAAWLAGADYIGLGPFRFTTTKEKLSPTLGLQGYSRIMTQCSERGIDLPVVAIGGITAADIPAVMATGVSGVAISSTILRAADPTLKTNEIINLISSLKDHV